MHFERSSVIALLVLSLFATSPSIQAAEKIKPAANNSSRIQQETDLAAQAYQAGDFQNAASHFQQVVRLDPNNIKAWLFLGESSAKIDDNMGARRAFAKVLSLQSSGQVADRAIEQLSKLPEPDLFKMQLDSGITLGDWLSDAEKEATQGRQGDVLLEVAQYLRQFGPVPQLLSLQEKLQKEVQTEHEHQLQQAIAAINVRDLASAKSALLQIRQLKKLAPGNLKLMQMEGKACHLMQDFACAESAYTTWLKAALGNDPDRKIIIAYLKQVKQRIAAIVTGQIFKDCEECPEMVMLSAGSFDMGGIYPNSKPIHRVTIAQPFSIGKTEITQGQYKAIMGSNPSYFKNCGDNCPVENVSWNDAHDFIKKLNEKTGKQYRLPTEAEWEYACRGGEQKDYCGSDDVVDVAWYMSYTGPIGTHPVALKQANAWGLYDMSGNVWEMTEDRYQNDYTGAPTDGEAWIVGIGERVVRGGSYSEESGFLRSYARGKNVGTAWPNYGFRVARALP